ncbi:MAG: GspE/PulE family protein [bacterium]
MRIPVSELKNKLLANDLVTNDQLVFADNEHEKTNIPIENILIHHGFVTEEAILKIWADQIHFPYVNLENLTPEPETVLLIQEEFAYEKAVIAIDKTSDKIKVCMANPVDYPTVEMLQKTTGSKIEPHLSSKGAILKKLSEYHDHYKAAMVEKLLASVNDEGIQLSAKMGMDVESVGAVAQQAPAVKTINLIILKALLQRASDIHLCPAKNSYEVFYRIDGILHLVARIAAQMGPAVLSRIKIMSKLDITEKRLPLDGSFHIKIENKEIDFRVATTPTSRGEKIVLRILDKGAMLLGLDHLGFNTEFLKEFKKQIIKPYGIVMIVGPTGSGKTTTLYSTLQTINIGDKNITTVEDPVEYQLEGLTQIQVNTEINLTFANCLRSILRQDPDVILIGEIRDSDTAEIAIRSSLTGHLVFATVHTNDAASAPVRLTDMEIKPYLLASSLRCVLSQRLVRTICPKCREPVDKETTKMLNNEIQSSIGFSKQRMNLPGNTVFFRGRGCSYCFNTGFKGRIALSEFMLINEEIRRLIAEKANAVTIKDAAIRNGMKTMGQDGLEKIMNGTTSVEEVLKVTSDVE